MHFPPYSTFPEITANRLILRQIHSEDLPALVEISFYDAQPARSVADAAAMQDKINQDYENGNSIHWCIADKETNEIAGTVGYYRGFDKGTGELGCVLKSQFQGLGIMTTAMQLAIAFGFNNIGLDSIIAITSIENHKAQKLLKRLRFIKAEGESEDKIIYQLKKQSGTQS